MPYVCNPIDFKVEYADYGYHLGLSVSIGKEGDLNRMRLCGYVELATPFTPTHEELAQACEYLAEGLRRA